MSAFRVKVGLFKSVDFSGNAKLLLECEYTQFQYNFHSFATTLWLVNECLQESWRPPCKLQLTAAIP